MNLSFIQWIKRLAPRLLLAASILWVPLDAHPTPALAATPASPPLAFVPNAGQTDPRVLFQASTPAGSLFFTPNQVVIVLPQAKAGALPQNLAARLGDAPLAPAPGGPAQVVQLNFKDADPAALVTGQNRLPGTFNYFFGSDPANWHTRLPSYAGITYQGLYPGIDLHYTGLSSQPGGGLKGTYTVAPGADPSTIQWRYDGAAVQVDAGGSLHIAYPAQVPSAPGPQAAAPLAPIELVEQAPISWQQIGARQVAVPTAYTVSAQGWISFALPQGYDPSQPLILDPTLVYSTYLGDTGEDNGSAIFVDATGIYVDGLTASTLFPTAGAPYQGAAGGGYEAFVTKFSPDGSTLLYSTFLGGSGTEYGLALAVDANRNAYLTGQTDSPNFPVSAGALDKTCGKLVLCAPTVYDAFVSRLSADGSDLLYSTYLGGDAIDIGNGIAVNANAEVYVAGQTYSTNFSTAGVPFQAANAGQSDGFAAKLDTKASGVNSLLYSTYIGGTGIDSFGAIVIDSSGNAYLTGKTASSAYPRAGVPYQNTLGGGVDALVTELTADGAHLVYSTFLGGSGNEAGFSIAIDANRQVAITGQTTSPNLPTTAGAFDRTCGTDGACNGYYDTYVARFNPAAAGAASLVFSTYFGGSQQDSGQGLAVDKTGLVYLTGYTDSEDMPVSNALQPACSWSCHSNFIDVFVTRFNATGSAITFSTFLGGSAKDYAMGIALDEDGAPYIVGNTYSNDFPVQAPYDDTNTGNTDAFVARIDPAPSSADVSVTTTSSRSPGLVNADLTYTVTITNNGPQPAAGLRLVDYLPLTVNYLATTTPQGSCQEMSINVISCELGTLASGGQLQVTIRVVPTSPGVIVNWDQVSSSRSDPDGLNNVVNISTPIYQSQNFISAIKR